MDYQTLLRTLLDAPATGSALRQTVAMEWTAARIGVATVGATASEVRYESLSPTDSEGVARLLNPTGQPSMVTRWIISLPRRHVILRKLELPSLDDRELLAMARLQVLPSLPFSENELVCDIQVLSRNVEAMKSTVWVVMLRKSVLDPILALGRSINRWPDGFVLSNQGLLNVAKARQLSTKGNVLLLEFSEGWLSIDVVSAWSSLISRAFPYAGERPTAAKLLKQCRESIQMAGVPETFVETVLASGFGNDLSAELEALASGLGLPAEIISPDAPWQASVLGATTTEASLNLLPIDIQETRRSDASRTQWLSTARWAGLWLASLLVVAGWKVVTLEWRLVHLQSQLNTLEPDAKKASRMAEEISVFHDLSTRRSLPLDILGQLHALAPSGLQLRSAAMQSNGSLLLDGRAGALSNVMAYVNALQTAPLFDKVDLRSSSLRSMQGGDRIDFQIEGMLHTHPTEFAHE